MHVGQLTNSHSINKSDESQKTAEHVQFSDESKTLVKENSTDFLLELGSVKLKLRKENRTEFQKTNTNSDTETFTKAQQSMIEEKKERNAQVADMSVAQKKVNSLFKPQLAQRTHINLLA